MAAARCSLSAAEHRAHKILRLRLADCNAGWVKMAPIPRRVGRSAVYLQSLCFKRYHSLATRAHAHLQDLYGVIFGEALRQR